ncbi:MAG: hypothetical protein IJY27_03565 [Clostridia bacterium]|nr:hypothetical protein [Clostridia bacterium]
MKRKILSVVLILCIVVAILFIPFNKVHYDDGGTVKITAIAYCVVKWKTVDVEDISQYRQGEPLPIYQNTCVYFFPNSLKDLDELWEIKH